MSGNKWWSTIAVWFSYIFNIFSEISLDFDYSIQIVPLKYLMYLLAGINTKQFLNILPEKYFCPLRMLNPFIKSFVIPLL